MKEWCDNLDAKMADWRRELKKPEEVANNLWNEWLRKVSVVADQGVGRRRLRKEIILDWDREVAKIIQLKNHYRKIRDNSQGEDRQSVAENFESYGNKLKTC